MRNLEENNKTHEQLTFVLGFADGNLVGNNVGLMLLQEESSIRLNAMMETLW